MRTDCADQSECVHNHGALRVVTSFPEPTNLTEQRNADEAMGRALRQLTTAAEAAGFIAHVHHYGCTYPYETGDPAWVTVTRWPTSKRLITVHESTLVEALDLARDRLNREEWDR